MPQRYKKEYEQMQKQKINRTIDQQNNTTKVWRPAGKKAVPNVSLGKLDQRLAQAQHKIRMQQMEEED